MADASQLVAKLEQFKSLDPRLLISRTEWGNIEFSAAAKDIDSVFEIVGLLRDLPLERLPTNAIQQIADALDRVLHWLTRNNNFTLQEGVPTNVRDEIVNNLAVQQQDLYVNTHNWIPFLAYVKGDIPQQLGRITTSVGQAEQANTDFSNYASEKRKEIDSVVQATREAAAEAGVGEFTKDFLADAAARDEDAGTWLTRATAATVVTLGVAIVFFFVKAPENQYSLIQFSTSKIVILAMLIGITAWCAGNYKANKHQATVGRFKAHALRTFQAFVQASDNPAVKDAVLLETTRAIFTHAQSGYLKGEALSESAPRILELIKGNSDSA